MCVRIFMRENLFVCGVVCVRVYKDRVHSTLLPPHALVGTHSINGCVEDQRKRRK